MGEEVYLVNPYPFECIEIWYESLSPTSVSNPGLSRKAHNFNKNENKIDELYESIEMDLRRVFFSFYLINLWILYKWNNTIPFHFILLIQLIRFY